MACGDVRGDQGEERGVGGGSACRAHQISTGVDVAVYVCIVYVYGVLEIRK